MSAYQPTKKEFISMLSKLDFQKYWELNICSWDRTNAGLDNYEIRLHSPADKYDDREDYLIAKGATKKPLQSIHEKYNKWATGFFKEKGLDFAKPEEIELFRIITTLDVDGMSTEVESLVIDKKNDSYSYHKSSCYFDIDCIGKVKTSEGTNSFWFTCYSMSKNTDLTESFALEKASELKRYFEKYLNNLPVLETA